MNPSCRLMPPSSQKKNDFRAGIADPGLSSTAHVAHFYSSDLVLLTELARRFGAVLRAGGAAVMVATPEHTAGIEELLSRDGLDLKRLSQQGRWVTLDAAATLADLSVERWPDEEKFNAVIGGVLDRLEAVTRPTVDFPTAIYGEMVALLWEQGHHEASMRLEELWEKLSEVRHFHLTCGWPLWFFNSPLDTLAVQRICARHTKVVPIEDSPDPSSTAPRRPNLLWRLKSQAILQRLSLMKRHAPDMPGESHISQPAAVTHIVDDALAAYRRRLHKKEISIRTRVQKDLRVHIPPAELNQIVSHMLSDAIEASPQKGTISLRTWHGRHVVSGVPGLRISVADSGVADEKMTRRIVMGPAFATTSDAKKRLGLWTVRELLQKHGGSILSRVEKNLGPHPGGTVLMLFLPAAAALPRGEFAA